MIFMRIMMPLAHGLPWDNRFILCRVESPKYLYGQGWEVTLAFQSRFFSWYRSYRELRVAFLGLSLHWRAR